MARRTVDEAIRAHRALANLGGSCYDAAAELNRLADLGINRLTDLEIGRYDTGELGRSLTDLEMGRYDAGELSRSLTDLEMGRYDTGELGRSLTDLEMGRYDTGELSRSLTDLEMGRYDTGELSRYAEDRQIFIDRIKNSDSLLDHIRAEHNALAPFRLPTIEETLRLSKIATEEFNAGLASVASIRQEELRCLTEEISTPWVDKSNALSSFESAALLSSVGNILRGAPFDSATSEALQPHLGDWPQTSLPRSIFSDHRAREAFFRDHGFDHRLTTLPEPAFTDFLDETGISHPALFPPGPPPTEEAESEESENDEHLARQRNLDAYDILFSLETQVRESLHRVMTDRYGLKWEKQRVPHNLRQEWEKKRDYAISKGEKEQSLLWYANFTDYIDIICQRNNWGEIFEPVFRDSSDIRVSLQRIHTIRIPTMHARLITKADILLLTVESHRILKAIDRLEDD